MSHGEVRAAIYLFRDPQGRVDDYVLTALRSLRPFVTETLLVSNGPLRPASRDRLAPVTDSVLERENTGLDVGGYRAGLAHLGWEKVRELDELLLLNHTFFAPVRPWAPVFEAAAERPQAAFWGLTEHAEQRPHPFLAQASMPRHLQSHFLVIRGRLLRDPAFREYWETMPPVRSYHDSIAHHESRFTPHFNALGHRSFAVFPAEDFHSLNPSLEEPMALLEAGCPALKRRLFFHDPLYLDSRGISGAALLRTAAVPELSEDTMLAGLVRTSTPRALLATAGLSEPVRSAEPRLRGGLEPSPSLPSLSDAERPVRLFLPVPAGQEPGAAERRARELAERHGLELVLREATLPGAGSLTTLLHDGADLLEGAGLILRLSSPASADRGEAAHDRSGTAAQGGARGQHADLLAGGGQALETALRLFAEHPGLGAVGQAAPVRGATALGHGLVGPAPAGPDHAASGHTESATTLAATSVQNALTSEQLAVALQELSQQLSLTTPLELASPVWSYGGSVLLRGEALGGLRGLDVEQLVAQHGPVGSESLLQLLEILVVLSAGWHYRQLLGAPALEDYALLEYRYQALAALLPQDPEEAQRYLASRTGENATLGSMLRRELEHRAPGVAAHLTPTYRRVTGFVSRIRGTC